MQIKKIFVVCELYLFTAIILFAFIIISNFVYIPTSYASNCITINKIQILDNKDLDFQEIRQIRNQYVGKCLKIEQIQEMVRLMTNYYVESGYITTRVYLPEQDLSNGVLKVSVQEGFIEDIEVLGTKKYGNIDFFPANLPLRRRKVLNLRDIEQSTDHYNKLKSNNINISLKPGTKPGGTILVIDNKNSKKWRVITGIDNAGSKQKGEVQSYSNINLENIIGCNELYSFGYRTSLDDPSITSDSHVSAIVKCTNKNNEKCTSQKRFKLKV